MQGKANEFRNASLNLWPIILSSNSSHVLLSPSFARISIKGKEFRETNHIVLHAGCAYLFIFSDEKWKVFNYFCSFINLGSVVLACIAFFWAGWSSKIFTVCDWYIKSASSRIRYIGRNEWRAKIPNTSWWPIYR